MHPVTRFALGVLASGICYSVVFNYTDQLLVSALIGTTVFLMLYSLVLAPRVRFDCDSIIITLTWRRNYAIYY